MLCGEEGPGWGGLRQGQPWLEPSSVAGHWPLGSLWVKLGPPSWTLSALLQIQHREQSRTLPWACSAPRGQSCPACPGRPRHAPPPLPVLQAHGHCYALSIIPCSEPLLSAGRPLRLERLSQLLLAPSLAPPPEVSHVALSQSTCVSLVAPSILQNNHISFFVSQNVYSISPPENANSSIRGPRLPLSLPFPYP